MAHEVETMAFTNEVPWHGLGVHVEDAPSVDEMLELAGLDWEVEKRQLTTTHEGKKVIVPDNYALVRSTDGAVLDVVGKAWKPIQNAQGFEFFREFVEAGDATMETAGSLRGGRYVWGLANLNTGFKLPGKDQVNGYLLVGIPHEQGKALVIKPTAIRVVCNNTLTMALRAGDAADVFRHAHRTEFNDSAIRLAKETLGLAREQIAEFEASARILHSTKMAIDDVVRIVSDVMAPNADVAAMIDDFDANATPRIKQIMDAYHNAPGAQPGTAWGALNAVTYYTDHMASRTADKRLTNAWLGKTSRQKTQVMNALLAAA